MIFDNMEEEDIRFTLQNNDYHNKNIVSLALQICMYSTLKVKECYYRHTTVDEIEA